MLREREREREREKTQDNQITSYTDHNCIITQWDIYGAYDSILWIYAIMFVLLNQHQGRDNYKHTHEL